MSTLPFSELVEINPRVKLEKSKEHPFIEMGIVEPGRRYVRADQKRIFQSGGAKFLPGDTLFARITPCLENGKIAQYQAAGGQAGFGSTEFLVFRARPGISDSGFVYYLSQSDLIRKPAEKSMSGASGRQRADIRSIVDVEVPAPPLPTQRKIAAILSGYDDLIENNLRRIKILEEMAQNLYCEWFVNFRFSGHEHARFTDSALGRIPQEWEVRRLDESCAAVLDGDWIETKDQGGEDYRLLQISNIGLGDFVETSNFRYVTQETFERLRCTEIQPDDFLIARMPSPIGRGWLARKLPWRIITAVDVAIARPDSRRICPVFLLYFWNQPSTLAAIEKQSSGTTRLRITRRQLCAMPILTPPLDLQGQFSTKVRPMVDLGDILRDQNVALRHTRDLLLPRLISGEVDVSELEIAIPEGAEA